MRAQMAVAAALSALMVCSPLAAQEVPHKTMDSRPSPWRMIVWGGDTLHGRATPSPRPVRFDTGLNPAFRIAGGEFAKPDGPAPKIPGPRAPGDAPRPYGVFSDIADRVDALVERYDKMEVRPVSMDDGGGLEYHVTFGAPQRD